MTYRAWLILALCAAALILYVLTLRQHASPASQFNAALGNILSCSNQRKNQLSCIQPQVKTMLGIKNSSEIMDTLATDLSLLRCHYIGHIVGQQTFIKYKNTETAINKCSRSCDDACIHGVIGEAFVEQLGANSPEAQNLDLEHLNPADVERVGGKLCSSFNGCHGVGHVLFQTYQDFDLSAAMCRKVAVHWYGGAKACISGSYMEYADALSGRNLRNEPRIKYPTDLKTFCSGQSTLDQRRSCFLYFPRIVFALIRKDGLATSTVTTRVQEICESYAMQGNDRGACFAGIGASYRDQVDKDPKSVRLICASFPRAMDQAACNQGVITVDLEGRKDKVAPYCQSLPTTLFRAACFQMIFYKLNISGGSVRDEMGNICGADELCVVSAKKYKLDPWVEMRRVFGS